jgi:hypothetical protein
MFSGGVALGVSALGTPPGAPGAFGCGAGDSDGDGDGDGVDGSSSAEQAATPSASAALRREPDRRL